MWSFLELLWSFFGAFVELLLTFVEFFWSFCEGFLLTFVEVAQNKFRSWSSHQDVNVSTIHKISRVVNNLDFFLFGTMQCWCLFQKLKVFLHSLCFISGFLLLRKTIMTGFWEAAHQKATRIKMCIAQLASQPITLKIRCFQEQLQDTMLLKSWHCQNWPQKSGTLVDLTTKSANFWFCFSVSESFWVRRKLCPISDLSDLPMCSRTKN